MQDYPLHGAVWAKQLVEDLKQRGYPVHNLLAQVDVHPRVLNAEDAKIPIDKVVGIFEAAAELTGDESIGFRFAQSRELRDAGLITYVGLSAPTVGDALTNISRYSRVFSEAAVWDVSRLYEQGRVEWHWNLPARIRRRQHVEWSATVLVRAMRMLTGRNLRPASVQLRYPRNANLPEYEKFFGCPLRFGASVNRIEFRLEDLRVQLITADNKLHRILRDHCELVLSQTRAHRETLVNRVERLIADRLSMNEANLETVATELGMSTRTLSRRLGDEGTNFKEVVDHYRQAIALEYLQNGDLGMMQIAFLLGYNEVSSLNHACKRWTGKTPGELRNGAA